MKNLLTTIAACMATLGAVAQQQPDVFYVGAKAGVAISTVIDNYSIQTSRHNDSKVGFTGGIFGGYDIMTWLGVGAEVVYSRQGALVKEHIEGNDIEFRELLQYVNVPLLVRFYPFENLSLYTGIQFGFLVGADQFLDVNGTKEQQNVFGECYRMEYSVPVGVSYEFAGKIRLDLRYNIGINDIYRRENLKAYGSVASVTLGYRFNFK